ncbi:hypothetical protein FJU30_03580 [Affinibrenneria salicis]|uniref:DUF3592 domain-containing protein n=1 Tax=Affinibrenneria salicis TaxID=2590031 RepID=A0A5J5G7Y0_9GAMM|nr:hypothetical protein [Affinibrenneria salicis]KAA9002639.1 hypothetical protein FJU30_01185 [Affinibrenneria salicis]KAA9003073.1 hypothetical protein FJU30_03580 [Affinibrenneria salicis]
MNFLSEIMPKLAIIVPLCISVFVIYIIVQTRQTASEDKGLIADGEEINAEIVSIQYNKNQNAPGVLFATITVRFFYRENSVSASRGVSFPVYKSEEVNEGKLIRIKFNKKNNQKIIFLDYNNF